MPWTYSSIEFVHSARLNNYLKIKSHLVLLLLETELAVELDVLVGAVEDDFVAAKLLGDVLELCDDAAAEVLAAARSRRDNVLNVGDLAAVARKLSLEDDGASSHELFRFHVLDHDDIVRVGRVLDHVESLCGIDQHEYTIVASFGIPVKACSSTSPTVVSSLSRFKYPKKEKINCFSLRFVPR